MNSSRNYATDSVEMSKKATNTCREQLRAPELFLFGVLFSQSPKSNMYQYMYRASSLETLALNEAFGGLGDRNGVRSDLRV